MQHLSYSVENACVTTGIGLTGAQLVRQCLIAPEGTVTFLPGKEQCRIGRIRCDILHEVCFAEQGVFQCFSGSAKRIAQVLCLPLDCAVIASGMVNLTL
jgi:hypothetical protein